MSVAGIVAVILVILGTVGWLFAIMEMRWGLALLLALVISAVMLLAGKSAGAWTYLAVLIPLALLTWDRRRHRADDLMAAPEQEQIR